MLVSLDDVERLHPDGARARRTAQRFVAAARACVAGAVVLAAVAGVLVWRHPVPQPSDALPAGGAALGLAVAWPCVLFAARRWLRRSGPPGTPFAGVRGLVPHHRPGEQGWLSGLGLAGWLLVAFQAGVLVMLPLAPGAGEALAALRWVTAGICLPVGGLLGGVIVWFGRAIPPARRRELAWTPRWAVERVCLLAVPFLLALPALAGRAGPVPKVVAGVAALWLLLVPISRQGDHMPAEAAVR
ncbi:hypothetical protein ACGFMM_31940 [Streptomyces sp. NPDC048604]|uniref:hypothetical protein n=1 Tax=Streptomyces sp. NPDC048604 TaxID=3365578 RepID=UPI00371EC262